MTPFSFLHSAYCLNLDRNEATRWVLVKQEFERVGLHVERINCIESPDNRFISFNQSHYNTVKRGYATGAPFAIFEDDVMFDPMWRHVQEAFSELPEDWDSLFLGCNFHSDWDWPSRYSQHLALLPNALMSHAIIYSPKGAKFVIDNFNPDIITAENPVYDEWIRVNMMPRGRTFVVNPMICYQRPNFSNVWDRPVDYTDIHIDGNKFLSQL